MNSWSSSCSSASKLCAALVSCTCQTSSRYTSKSMYGPTYVLRHRPASGLPYHVGPRTVYKPCKIKHEPVRCSHTIPLSTVACTNSIQMARRISTCEGRYEHYISARIILSEWWQHDNESTLGMVVNPLCAGWVMFTATTPQALLQSP